MKRLGDDIGNCAINAANYIRNLCWTDEFKNKLLCKIYFKEMAFNLDIVLERLIEEDIDTIDLQVDGNSSTTYILNIYSYIDNTSPKKLRLYGPASFDDDGFDKGVFDAIGETFSHILAVALDKAQEKEEVFEDTSEMELSYKWYNRFSSMLYNASIYYYQYINKGSNKQKEEITLKEVKTFCKNNDLIIKDTPFVKKYIYKDRLPNINELYKNWLKRFYARTTITIKITNYHDNNSEVFNIFIDRRKIRSAQVSVADYANIIYGYDIDEDGDKNNTVSCFPPSMFVDMVNEAYDVLIKNLEKYNIEFNNSRIETIVVMKGEEKNVRKV